MDQKELLNYLGTCSEYEIKHYLNLWQLEHPRTLNGSNLPANQLFTPANAGDMARLALLCIVTRDEQGENWFREKLNNEPYLGEAQNFSKKNTRDAGEVITLLSVVMLSLGSSVKFSLNRGKVDFSLSFDVMKNPLFRLLFHNIVSATPWYRAQVPDPVVVILTPIEVEQIAVLRQLPTWKSGITAQTQTNYAEAYFQGQHHRFCVINQRSGSGLLENGIAIERAVQAFKPDLILMVGVAGGVKDVSKGDLVIGEKAYGYERGKQLEETFVARPQVHNYTHRLLQCSQTIAQNNSWQTRVQGSPDFPITAAPRVFFGPIASGNKVLASARAHLAKFLKQHYNDTLAIEMEAIGFQALLPYPQILSLNIRGISDLLDDKTSADQENHQELAAARAAAFAFELLDQLDLRDLIA